MTHVAFAADSTNTIGGVVYDAGSDLFNPVLIMLSGISYMLSVWMAGNGLWYLKKANDENEHGNKSTYQGLARILGAGALGALPDTLNAGILTFLSGTGNYTGNIVGAGSVSSCLSSEGSTNALTCVAENVGRNIVPVTVQFIFIGCFIIGAGIILRELYKLSTHHEGARITMGSIFTKMVVGIICCNVPAFFYAFEGTLGINDSTITGSGAAVGDSVPSMLSYTPSSNVAVLQSFSQLISWCFVFLVLVGVLSFVRGVAILYAQADGGGGRNSTTSAFVHMVAGILLANGKMAMCFIMTSFIGDGIGFCN